MERERNYGIDLLRLILMFMVSVLHTLGQGGILRASTAGTNGYRLFWLMETAAYCAVDGFALISGYVAANRPRKYEKLTEMWFQVFFYSFILTLILKLVLPDSGLDWSKVFECALPVFFNKYWYFTAFFALYFAIPLLNRFLFSLEESAAKKALLLLFILYSVIGYSNDPFCAEKGYSTIWLMVLYCIGVLAKQVRLFEKRSTAFLIFLWFVCVFASWAEYMFGGNKALINYVSPTILLCGMLMVVVFSRLKLKGRVISKLAPLAFGVYLFQLSPVIWSRMRDAFSFVVGERLRYGIPHSVLIALALFAAGLLVEWIRSKAAKLLRIPQLSLKLTQFLGRILEKLTVLLK